MAGAAETARLIAELGFRDKFTPGATKALGTVAKLDKGISRVGKGAGQLSGGLARAGALVGTAVVAGFAGAAKAAIDWEDAFQGVVKTVDEADLNAAGLTFRDLELSLRKMSTEMPTTAIELAAIAEAAGAMGIAGKDIEAFTRQVAILASTTNVSAEEAATALGQLTNVIGLSADEFDNFAASLVDLGNKGSSTEAQILEIAKRAGGAAKLFGIAKEETLGWAAAAANLGLNEELAGTALQNVFIKLLPKFNEGAKSLQKITGKTAAALQKSFKEDAGGAVEDLMRQLGALPKDRRLKAIQELFGKGSGITRLVNGLAESYAKNLKPSLETATKSWFEATAAQEEFDKRNATVRSSINRLRNGLIDAAIQVGEGFVPALGRASDKLATFLKSDANRNELKKIGEDIGKAIDGIDWNQVLSALRDVVSILRVAFDWAKRLFDVFNALPTEIKGATAGLLALNKLSGGLVGAGLGNIVGGLGEGITRSLGAQLPGALGKAFVQPVFVTNWAMMGGGLGGGAGAAGAVGKGLSGLSKVFLVGEAIGLAIAVNEVREEIGRGATRYSADIKTQTSQFIASQPPREQLVTSLAAIDTGIRDLQSNPLNVLVQGEALDNLRAMRVETAKALQTASTSDPKLSAIERAIAGIRERAGKAGKTPSDKAVIATLHRNRERQAADAKIQAQKANEIKEKARQTAAAVRDADLSIDIAKTATVSRIGSASQSNANQISATIRANRPIIDTRVIVNVTAAQVQSSTTTQNRYGPGNGSAGSDTRDRGGGGV